MSAKVVPSSSDRCHWTVGAGAPDPAAVNEYVDPVATVVGAGCAVTAAAIVGIVTWTDAVYRSNELLAPAGLLPVELELSAQIGTMTPPWKARPV